MPCPPLSQFGGPLVAVVIGVGVFTIVLGVAHFVLAWGLFKGKGWTWIITVILAVISVILSIVSIASGGRTNIISLIISAVRRRLTKILLVEQKLNKIC